MSTPLRQMPRKCKGQALGQRTINGTSAVDVRGAARLIGGPDTEKQIRGLVERRLIPFRKLGGRIIFLRAELEAWLSGLDGCTVEEARGNLAARNGKSE
ncbi:MAG: hypothetical protein ABIR36_17240 [Nitrospiraceae bacterium]